VQQNEGTKGREAIDRRYRSTNCIVRYGIVHRRSNLRQIPNSQGWMGISSLSTRCGRVGGDLSAAIMEAELGVSGNLLSYIVHFLLICIKRAFFGRQVPAGEHKHVELRTMKRFPSLSGTAGLSFHRSKIVDHFEP
jgi:hypothetical protein